MRIVKANVLLNCHAIYKIMTKPQKKSNAILLAEAKDNLAKAEQKHAELSKGKGLIMVAKEAEKIIKYKAEIERLEPIKGEILLSRTTKEYLLELVAKIKFKRCKEQIDAPQTRKGTKVEEYSIKETYSRFYGMQLEKNTDRRTNHFLTGECDIEVSAKGKTHEIIDAKNRYTLLSFLKVQADGMQDKEFYQLQGYCSLWNCQKSRIASILENNVFEEINQAIDKEAYRLREIDLPLWMKMRIARNHIFTKDYFIEFLTQGVIQHLPENEVLNLDLGIYPDKEVQKEWDDFVELTDDERVFEMFAERDDEVLEEIEKEWKICLKWLEVNHGIIHDPNDEIA